MTATALLSIIIVNYNGSPFIEQCFDSIFASQTTFSFEIIVIDNASTDDSLSVLRRYQDRIHLIESPDNLGFSKGNNACLPYCNGQYLLLLNNDTLLTPNALQTMVDYFAKHPTIGALSPKLLNADGSIQVQGSSLGAWRFHSKTPRQVPFICGAALLTSKALYTQIGGLDENLFFYNDDVDFCKQLNRLKKPIIYLPQAQVTHFGGLSTKTIKPQSMVEGYRGSLYLCAKFYPAPVYYLYRLLIWLDLGPKLIFYSLFAIISKSKIPYRNAMLDIAKIVITGNVKRTQ